MPQDLGLAFRLTADAGGLVAGAAQAEKHLNNVGRAARATSKEFAAAARITESVATPTEKYAATIDRLDGFLERGLVTQEVYGRAVAKADAELSEAEGGLSAYGAAASKVEETINRVAASIGNVGQAAGSIAETADRFVDLGVKIAKVSGVYAAFRALTTNRAGVGSITALALGFTKSIGVIKAAQFALGTFGVEAEGMSRVAVAAAIGVTAIKAAAMAGWDSAGVKAYASTLDDTYRISALATKGLTTLGVSAATQSKLFASLGASADAGLGLVASGATVSALSFANYAATAYLVAKAMFAARSAIEPTAKAMQALALEAATAGRTFQDLHIQKMLDAGVARGDIIKLGMAINELDRSHLDDLADSMARGEKAAERYNTVWGNVGKTLGSPLLGLFASLRDGWASMTDGMTDFGAGLYAIAQPVGQVLRPFGTLVGTLLESGMRLVGILGSVAGVILRVVGAAAQLTLAVPIKGFNVFADALRGGVGSAFDSVSKKIEYAHKLLDDFYNFWSSIPFVGQAFASNLGGINKPAPMAAVPEGAADSRVAGGPSDTADEYDAITDAIGQHEQALSKAIATAAKYGDVGTQAAIKYQDGLRSLEQALNDGMFNETTFAVEADKLREAFEAQTKAIDDRQQAIAQLAAEDMDYEVQATQAITRATNTYFAAAEAASRFGAAGAAAAAEYEGGLTSLSEKLKDGRLNETSFAAATDDLSKKFKRQVEVLQEAENGQKRIADAQKKRDNDVARMEKRVGDADNFKDLAAADLKKSRNTSLEVSDIRSSEGIAQFMALASGREDPAIAEYRKSHETLKSMLAELKALQAAPLEIAGGAGGG